MDCHSPVEAVPRDMAHSRADYVANVRPLFGGGRPSGAVGDSTEWPDQAGGDQLPVAAYRDRECSGEVRVSKQQRGDGRGRPERLAQPIRVAPEAPATLVATCFRDWAEAARRLVVPSRSSA
jgi:hypothetical protein